MQRVSRCVAGGLGCDRVPNMRHNVLILCLLEKKYRILCDITFNPRVTGFEPYLGFSATCPIYIFWGCFVLNHQRGLNLKTLRGVF